MLIATARVYDGRGVGVCCLRQVKQNADARGRGRGHLQSFWTVDGVDDLDLFGENKGNRAVCHEQQSIRPISRLVSVGLFEIRRMVAGGSIEVRYQYYT